MSTPLLIPLMPTAGLNSGLCQEEFWGLTGRSSKGDVVAQRKFIAFGERWVLNYVHLGPPVSQKWPGSDFRMPPGSGDGVEKSLELQKRGSGTRDVPFRVAYIFADGTCLEDDMEQVLLLRDEAPFTRLFWKAWASNRELILSKVCPTTRS
jgi:hypothetical protein